MGEHDLRQYAVGRDEAEMAQMYYMGDTEQRIAQMYAISRHRVKEIISNMRQRKAEQRLPLTTGEEVSWYGLDRAVWRGTVLRALSVQERYDLNIRADTQDVDWYWIATVAGSTLAKMGAFLWKGWDTHDV
jgi:site-specific DNA-adenine methylase